MVQCGLREVMVKDGEKSNAIDILKTFYRR